MPLWKLSWMCVCVIVVNPVVGVLLPEQLPDPPHAAEALLHVMFAIPKIGADALICQDVVLSLVLAWPLPLATRDRVQTPDVRVLPPILVVVDAVLLVQNARQVIQADFACI